MCNPSQDRNVSSGNRSNSCQRRIRAKRWKTPTCAAAETVEMIDTTRSASVVARIFGDDVGIKTRQRRARFVAIDPAVEHGDLLIRQKLREFLCEPAWIGGRARARSKPVGRRGTQRDDLNRQMVCNLLCGAGEGST